MLKRVTQPIFNKEKVKPMTQNRKLIIRLQRFMWRFLKPSGLSIKVDFNYHGSYLFNPEERINRLDPITGRQDADVISRYLSQNDVVLEIGCGAGRIEKFLAPQVRKLYGVDISPKAIKLGRQYNKEHQNCYLYENNGQDLYRFGNNKFDFIFSVGTFQHMSVEDSFCFFVESFRCLKPGGKILFQFRSLKHWFDQFAYQAIRGDGLEARPRYFTSDQLQLVFNQIGYDIENIIDGGFEIWPRCIWIFAKKPLKKDR